MQTFTIRNGIIQKGIKVESYRLKTEDVIIPAVIVGARGRGPGRGIMPIKLTDEQYEVWLKKKSVQVHNVIVGTTRKGKPRLISCEENHNNNNIVCVFRTKISKNDANGYFGDHDGAGEALKPFPGRTLLSSCFTLDNNWHELYCEQIVAILPQSIFSTTSSKFGTYFYKWDGLQLLGGLSPEERIRRNIF